MLQKGVEKTIRKIYMDSNEIKIYLLEKFLKNLDYLFEINIS